MNSIIIVIEKKEKDKILLNKKIEAKICEIINLNIEISSLEKLREKEHEKYNQDFAKNEEIFIDEFISNTMMIKRYMF
jgi:flagellar FliJ protein